MVLTDGQTVKLKGRIGRPFGAIESIYIDREGNASTSPVQLYRSETKVFPSAFGINVNRFFTVETGGVLEVQHVGFTFDNLETHNFVDLEWGLEVNTAASPPVTSGTSSSYPNHLGQYFSGVRC